jgi:outer membrane lipoprotein-sorting protein
MKSTQLIALAILSTATLLFSCKSKTSETAVTSENPAATETATPKGRYAIKSGIVEYKTQMMGMDMKQTLTFDDYGKKEATDMEMDMMGVKIHTVTITKDGFMYTLDLEKKTGTKVASYQGSNQNIDFENLSEEMVKDMNLKKEGTEEYLGKTCEKMSIDYTKMKMKGTFLVYKGVALQSDIDMGTTKMKLIGEKFTENPEIPAEKFEVPADVKVVDNK